MVTAQILAIKFYCQEPLVSAESSGAFGSSLALASEELFLGSGKGGGRFFPGRAGGNPQFLLVKNIELDFHYLLIKR